MDTIVSTNKKITLCETTIELDEEEKRKDDELQERKRRKKEADEEAEFQRKMAAEREKEEEEQAEAEKEGVAMSSAVVNGPKHSQSVSLGNLVINFHGN